MTIFRWLRYQKGLFTAQRRHTKLSGVYDRLFQKARQDKSDKSQLDSLEWERRSELGFIEDQIEALVSGALIAEAHRLMLPIPEYQEDGAFWERSSFTGGAFLTRKGMVELRASIRAERAARRDGALAWFAALTGIVGAITGLVAVWKG